MYSTGCRIGEVVKLNREDIDFQTNSVIVQGKGDKKGKYTLIPVAPFG